MGSTDFTGFGSSSSGVPPTQPGPYIFDPDAGFGITSTSTTTAVHLDRGQQYKSLPVADASQFPDQDGYIVLAFGRSIQVGPVRYLGRLSATELMLDFSFRFTQTLPVGVDVTLLIDRVPFVPAHPESVGSFYLTASTAGRVAAEAAIDAATAAGVNVVKTIEYPGDRGLGNEGRPDSGSPKVNDRVGIWAGADEDAEIETAREGG